jgi:uncharacterized protein (TIGR02757 family)
MASKGASENHEAEKLEALYGQYNHRCFVHPDPLEFLYRFENPGEREVVGLIASCLAYGKVAQILKSISLVLERMGPSPARFLLTSRYESIRHAFRDFKHRFTGGEDLARLLWRIKEVVGKYGSLQNCFMAHFRPENDTVVPALEGFAQAFFPAGSPFLIPAPSNGSACKRLNLFLRWMVRQDEVDPGGWDLVPPSKLVVPLDTHMHRIGLLLRFTNRRQADLQTAMGITDAFRKVAPHDPVKYDFVLTRLGIWSDRRGIFEKPILHKEMGNEDLCDRRNRVCG